ncbi:YggT family protein [Catenovulum sp. 2E275]|uniref:YggT family protein n=1 Tax=Catenovulum sp. 2E275 TaxID=2980497 RepID=UPI0021CFC5EB|nr:YggT family protein [Catenovulum sp. 2E275]MCU4674510.1 YggT family protein [Catenovulum sp. 2E275]
MNALNFLIQIFFSLLLMVVVLRFWMQAANADFYNPLCQFIVKVTNPILKPFQLILPYRGKWNFAALALAFVVAAAKFIVIMALNNISGLNPVALAVASVMTVIREFLDLAFWILIIRAILSWFSQGNNPAEYILYQLTEPFLRPIRNILPPMGGLDLSVLVAIIAIQFINLLLGDLVGRF